MSEHFDDVGQEKPAAWQWSKNCFVGTLDGERVYSWSSWEEILPPCMEAYSLAKTDPEHYKIRPLYARPSEPVYKHSGDWHPDDTVAVSFCYAMRGKLAESREKGRGGWEDPLQCSGAHLSALLVSQIEKGDPVDIANFCMMLRHRKIPASEIQAALSEYIVNRSPPVKVDADMGVKKPTAQAPAPPPPPPPRSVRSWP